MRETTGGLLGCGGVLGLLTALAIPGALCFQYALGSIAGKNVPWYADLVVGGIFSSFTIPAAVICWILRLCGVEAPFLG